MNSILFAQKTGHPTPGKRPFAVTLHSSKLHQNTVSADSKNMDACKHCVELIEMICEFIRRSREIRSHADAEEVLDDPAPGVNALQHGNETLLSDADRQALEEMAHQEEQLVDVSWEDMEQLLEDGEQDASMND
ncbi:hypothetical protein QR680_000823 [Steinernema hermaphroditum]|uniref:Uncharacterized protein n=1 Tax=Steinernema hermaphroditum TaxID=289476 RepID=A0AA39LES2_9BILA|nr:hypothetical protein QR680_000823 [Steinernema hermaphroditum]